MSNEEKLIQKFEEQIQLLGNTITELINEAPLKTKQINLLFEKIESLKNKLR